MSVAVGTVNAANGAFTLTTPFPAKALMMIGGFNTADLSANLDAACLSVGFGTPSDQHVVAFGSEFQTFVPFNDSGTHHDTGVAEFVHNAAEGGSGGPVVSITGWPKCTPAFTGGTGSVNQKLRYILFGGTTLQAKVGSFQLPGSGAGATVTGFPWDPSSVPTCLLGMIMQNGHPDNAQFGFWAVDDSLSQWSNHYVAPNLSRGGIAHQDTAAPLATGGFSVSAWTSDGFTVSTGTEPNVWDCYYLALADPAGVFTAGTRTWGSSTPGGSPDGVIVCDAWNDPASGNHGADLSIGAFTAVNSVNASVRNRYDDGSEPSADRYRYTVSSEAGPALAVYDPDTVELGSITGAIPVAYTASGTPSPTPPAFGYLEFTCSDAGECRNFVPTIYRRL